MTSSLVESLKSIISVKDQCNDLKIFVALLADQMLSENELLHKTNLADYAYYNFKQKIQLFNLTLTGEVFYF